MPDQRGYEDRGCPRSQVPAFNVRERCNLATPGYSRAYCINQPWLTTMDWPVNAVLLAPAK